MSYFSCAALFSLGLAFGSFLNVVSLRYEPGQRLLDLKIIGGRSRCPHCQKTLKWYELMPLLSFLIQKGKCRSCGIRLSFQYPLVELLGGLIFVFVPLSLYKLFIIHDSLFIIQASLWLLIFILFLLLSIIDFRNYVIPDSINLSLAGLGIILAGLSQISDYGFKISDFDFSFLGHYSMLFGQIENIWSNRFSAALLAAVFFGAIIILTRGRGMGWGDFKLAGALGLIFGWPDILLIFILAFIVGAIAVAPLLLRKQKTMKDVVPFGPFIIIGASLIFFFGKQIIDIYFKFFGIIY